MHDWSHRSCAFKWIWAFSQVLFKAGSMELKNAFLQLILISVCWCKSCQNVKKKMPCPGQYRVHFTLLVQSGAGRPSLVIPNSLWTFSGQEKGRFRYKYHVRNHNIFGLLIGKWDTHSVQAAHFALYWITYGTEFTSGRHLTNNGVSVKWETTVKNKEALTARGITYCLHVPFMLKARTIWKHRKTRNKFAISFKYLFYRIQGQFDSINTSLYVRPVCPLRSSQCQRFLMVQA